MKSTIKPFQRFARHLLLSSCIAAMLLPVMAPAQTPWSKAPTGAETAVEETDHRPEKFSPGRYRGTFASSAFEREILPPAKVDNAPPPTPFELNVVGVTGKDGRYRVTLVDKKGKYVVVTDEPNADGYRYAEIEPAANIAEFRVQIIKDGQTEWAEFDDKRFSVAAKVAAAPQGTRPGRPNIVPTSRQQVPSRAPVPQSNAAKEANQKTGQAAINTINAANAKAVEASTNTDKNSDKSRVNGRRVVLPPTRR